MRNPKDSDKSIMMEDSMKSTFSTKITAVKVSINANLSSGRKNIIRGKTASVQLDANLRVF